ncbi:MAG: Mur ligase family protein [Patescibacteria group bacterium]
MTKNSVQKIPAHLHIIGICGVATSALAIAFHKKGVKVTGSDKGFFPPVSIELEKQKIEFYAGWHPEKMVANGRPDTIIIGGGGTSPSNPEIIYAKEHNISVYSYAEILQKYFIKKNSIVVTGTWGKTTISAMLSFVLLRAKMDPSYFTGGLSLSHDTGALSDSNWSVVEGDEYQVSISDHRPKFVYYSPTYLILTSVSWDHADLYPTEKAYFDEFRNLVNKIPENGKIVACIDNDGVKKIIGDKLESGERIITYGKTAGTNYQYDSVIPTKNGLDFIIESARGRPAHASFKIHSPMLGRFNAENITAVFAMASEVGIKPEKIIKAIAEFKGIKRRFEKRFEGEITVMDCHAPTPEKAASVLENIKEVYKNKIIAVYEPNIGGRQRSSAGMYDGAFKDADIVIVPRLTKLKIERGPTSLARSDLAQKPLEGDELARIIGKTHTNVHYLANDEDLVTFLKSEAKRGDMIAFLGSHGFRGMIEETVKKFQ